MDTKTISLGMVAFLLSSMVSAPATASPCTSTKLSQEARALVKPVLMHAAEDIRRRASGLPDLDPYIEVTLETMLRDNSAASNEAIAYLLNLYLGEGPGTLLVINAINRGSAIRAPLEAFEKCLPNSGMESLPAEMKGSGVLPKLVLDSGFGKLNGIGRSKRSTP